MILLSPRRAVRQATLLIYQAIATVTAAAQPDTAQLPSVGFGLGVGTSLLEREHIRETTLVNGVVRVTASERTQRAFWLETHYLLDRFVPASWKYFSWGPFVAAQLQGGNNILNGFGGGLMASLKRTKRTDKTNNAALNFGIGYVTTQVSQLGSGILEDMALPDGDESIRMRARDSGAWLFLVSFNFFSVPLGRQADTTKGGSNPPN